LRVAEVLEEGWSFGWGFIEGSTEEIFTLEYLCLEWRFSGCDFEEALGEYIDILESSRWN